MSALDALAELERRTPEWQPWLAVVAHVLREAENKAWAAAVPDIGDRTAAGAPLLAQAVIRIDRASLEPFVCRLQSGVADSVEAQARVRRAALTVFERALEADHAGLMRLASELGLDTDAFAARAALAPVPFLHACRAQWTARITEQWSEGYCPVCGAWPAFAEVRGVERTRHLRCGRCGCGWQTSCLLCPYCGTTDHDALQSLVVESSVPPSTIEVCKRCNGYVKAFSTLQASPPASVILTDLSTAELDFSVLRRGCHRTSGLGRSLAVTLTAAH